MRRAVARERKSGVGAAAAAARPPPSPPPRAATPCQRLMPQRRAPPPALPLAVFSVFDFHFTYALTLIHTVTTLFGMQGFLRVRARHRPRLQAALGTGLRPAVRRPAPAASCTVQHAPGCHVRTRPAPPLHWRLVQAGMFERKEVPKGKLLPLAAAYVGYIVLCNLNLNLNPVGFYQITKIAGARLRVLAAAGAGHRPSALPPARCGACWSVARSRRWRLCWRRPAPHADTPRLATPSIALHRSGPRCAGHRLRVLRAQGVAARHRQRAGRVPGRGAGHGDRPTNLLQPGRAGGGLWLGGRHRAVPGGAGREWGGPGALRAGCWCRRRRSVPAAPPAAPWAGLAGRQAGPGW